MTTRVRFGYMVNDKYHVFNFTQAITTVATNPGARSPVFCNATVGRRHIASVPWLPQAIVILCQDRLGGEATRVANLACPKPFQTY